MDPSSPSPLPKHPPQSERPTDLPHPLSHSTSDSILGTGTSIHKRKTSRKVSSRSRQTRSAASSRTSSVDGSNLSMEDYSIDLAKLGERDSSWTIGNAGQRQIERVSSRDDGPEDFTLRLGEWMRGTLPYRPGKDQDRSTAAAQNAKYADENQNCTRAEAQVHETAKSKQPVCDTVEDSAFLPAGTSIPAPGEQKSSNSRQSAPPFSRMNTEAMQDRAAQEVFDQISALQAEAERLRVENSDLISAHRSSQHTSVQHQKECRILKTQVDDLRSEAKRLQDSEFRASQKVLRLEQDIKRDSSKVGSIRAKFEPLSQELETVKLRAEADKQCADSTINALKSDLKASKDHAARAQADLTMAHSTHGSEMENIKAEMDALRTKFQHREDVLKEQLQGKEDAIDTLKAERAKAVPYDAVNVKDLQEQLAESRKQLRNVEDENELLASDNERQAEEINNMQQTLEEERLHHLSSTDGKVAELEDEIARMQAQKTNDRISYSDHQSALDELREEHSTATTKLIKEHEHEVQTLRAAIQKAAEGMKKREQRIISSHQEESKTLKKRITSLEAGTKTAPTTSAERSAGEKKTGDDAATIAQLRTQITTLNTRLNSARKDLQQASTQVEEVRTQMSQSNAEYEAHVNKQVKAHAEKLKKTAEEYIKAEVAKLRASNKYVQDQANHNPVQEDHAANKPVQNQASEHRIVKKRKSFRQIDKLIADLTDDRPVQDDASSKPVQNQAQDYRTVKKRKSVPRIERPIVDLTDHNEPIPAPTTEHNKNPPKSIYLERLGMTIPAPPTEEERQEFFDLIRRVGDRPIEMNKRIQALVKEKAEREKEREKERKEREKETEEREREWRRRIKVVFQSREQIGRCLMEAWGRQECGVAKEGERQRYRYKYVDRAGKVMEEGV
ncbi:MAG: hypothetical protein Q9174_005193 [Haloplaca sp. 1 TL-2023]